MMRILNICVIAALIAAAGYVYKIKFESTRQAERVAKLRMEIRREHDAIAMLRAEWSKLDNPLRIQELAKRHTALKPIEGRQFDKLDRLPARPADVVPPDAADPIGILIDMPTASVAPARTTAAPAAPKPSVPTGASKSGLPPAPKSGLPREVLKK